MHPARRYYLALIASFLAGLALIMVPVMGINYMRDPYQFYRLHGGPEGPFRNAPRRQNAALIRHLDYDTVLLGTSRSENFAPDMFTASGWKVVKLTAPGSAVGLHALFARSAIAERAARRVLIELSASSYVNGPDFRNQRAALPEYLYEVSFATPFQYLLSIDLLELSLGLEAGEDFQPLAHLYDWYDLRRAEFGSGAFLGRHRLACGRDLKAIPVPTSHAGIDASIDAVLVPLIEAFPGIDFIGFLPPEPLVAMYVHSPESLGRRLYFRRRMSALAAEHANLRVHDFTGLMPLVADVTRFKEISHYDRAGNREMAVHLMAGDSAIFAPGEADPLPEIVRRELPAAECERLRGRFGG